MGYSLVLSTTSNANYKDFTKSKVTYFGIQLQPPDGHETGLANLVHGELHGQVQQVHEMFDHCLHIKEDHIKKCQSYFLL